MNQGIPLRRVNRNAQTQFLVMGFMLFVLGMLTGMILMGLFGPYVMERAREDRRAAAYQEHKKQEELENKQFQEGFGKFMDDFDKKNIQELKANRERMRLQGGK